MTEILMEGCRCLCESVTKDPIHPYIKIGLSCFGMGLVMFGFYMFYRILKKYGDDGDE